MNSILQRKFEQLYFPKVEKVIKDRISSLIRVIEVRGIDAGRDHLYRQVDSGGLGKVIEGLYLTVGVRSAKIQWQDLQRQKRLGKKHKETDYLLSTKANGKRLEESLMQVKGFGFNESWVQFIKDYLYRFLLEKIVFRVSESTRNALLNVLSDAVQKGWGINETVKELEDLPLSKTQAARIVRTEITRAANTGAMAAGDTFEFEQNKEWISALDRRTRGRDPEDHASHVGLDGQIIPYEEPFTDPRNGDKLMFPGDPNAMAESTINCRCSVAIIAKRDLQGRLIPKKNVSV